MIPKVSFVKIITCAPHFCARRPCAAGLGREASHASSNEEFADAGSGDIAAKKTIEGHEFVLQE